MKNIKRKITGFLMVAVLLCISTTSTIFAAETIGGSDIGYYDVKVSSEGVTSITDEKGNVADSSVVRSSISGSGEGTLNSGYDGIQVFVNTSGWGGMGVTVNASSSWNGYMSMDMLGSDGSKPVRDKAVHSNGETYCNNLNHYNPAYYLFTFKGIPSGQSVYIRIWIYG